ncbi:MAG TPA: M28 family peptidase [Vicinamibacteria bacterium]|nr:M28 family peptidase [Vicinamibacteria bacterium]
MGLREVGFFLRGRLSTGVSRLANARRPGPPSAPPPLADVLAAAARPPGRAPLALVPLLEGRANPEREAAVAAYLHARGFPFARHRFATFEGAGENFAVDVGPAGGPLLLLIAHHDAVPGSPGANDNAAAVAILLHLLERRRGRPPARLRLRCLFTAAEELGYLGARAYAPTLSPAEVLGVVSLELCGIGDALALWDAAPTSPFVRTITGALEARGRRADAGYHVVGRIPVFGSDHRAFAARGVPALGLSVVPSAEAEALRRFVLSPVRSALHHAGRRPPPFDTYHTRGDRAATLEAGALDLVGDALEAVVDAFDR